MSRYYVVTSGYSAIVSGPFEYESAKEEAEKRASRGHMVMLVEHLLTCMPKPLEIEWVEVQS
ncbi:MAG: hypothetical protein AB7E55_00675 [Pigmentiphaga sp.]